MIHPDILPYRIVSAEEAVRPDSLEPALASTIRNPLTKEIYWDEVQGVIRSVTDSITGRNDRTYGLVEAPDGTAVGVMGIHPLTDPTERMYPYAITERPAEVINAYFDPVVRGKGIGRALLGWLEIEAQAQNHTELLVASGPRYQRTGWPFWRRMYGSEIDIASGYFDGAYPAAIWRKVLETAN